MNRSFKRALLFTGTTLAVSWLIFGLVFRLLGEWSTVASAGYMFLPGIVAIVLQKLVYKDQVIKPLAVSFKLNRWFLVAWMFPLLLIIGTFGVSLLFPGVDYSSKMEGMLEGLSATLPPEKLQQMKEQAAVLPVHPVVIALLAGLAAGLTVNAVAGLGEELGWRGFLQKNLEELGFWKSSVLIGLIWGVWHAPIILQGHNYPEHPLLGVVMMIIFCILLAPIFSFIRLKSGSVIAASVLHGTLNGTGVLAIILIKGGNDLLVGITGLAGFIVLAMANLLLAVSIRCSVAAANINTSRN